MVPVSDCRAAWFQVEVEWSVSGATVSLETLENADITAQARTTLAPSLQVSQYLTPGGQEA